MSRTPASRHSFSATLRCRRTPDIEPEEKSAGRPRIAVAVADDLIGEIELRDDRAGDFLHMRFVAIGRAATSCAGTGTCGATTLRSRGSAS